MFDFSKMEDARIPANELVKGDLVVIHNPFILNNKLDEIVSMVIFYGPGVVLSVKQPTSKLSPKDAVEVEVMFSDNEIKVSIFWGTLWHFYKM